MEEFEEIKEKIQKPKCCLSVWLCELSYEPLKEFKDAPLQQANQNVNLFAFLFLKACKNQSLSLFCSFTAWMLCICCLRLRNDEFKVVNRK